MSDSYLRLLQPDLVSTIRHESHSQQNLKLDIPGPTCTDWSQRIYHECIYCGHQTKAPSFAATKAANLGIDRSDRRAWNHFKACQACCNFRKFWGFNLTYEIRAMLDAAPWCWICGSQEDLHIDHCHSTNRVRGYLCKNHNTALGHFKDDPTLLHIAIDYLIPPDEITY